MGGSRDIADVPAVLTGAKLAIRKHRVAAAEDEIHRSFDQAIIKPLLHFPTEAKFLREEALVPLLKIRGQRAEKQGVLCGGKGAVFHGKAAGIHRQGDLLTLYRRVARVIDDTDTLDSFIGKKLKEEEYLKSKKWIINNISLLNGNSKEK